MTIDAGTNAELTALWARVAELESDNARLHQALDDYGMHTTNCDIVYYDYMGKHECNCGFNTARQRKDAK